MKAPSDSPYLRVVVNEDGTAPQMYLYGYIGQDFWWDDDLNEESITDLAFVKEFSRLEKEYDEIHIRINSPGGSVTHGDPIIAAIRQSQATVHTWNDGLAGSMAADIWMAGDVRHMAQNAKLMIHATWSVAMGNAADLRREADVLDKFDSVAIDILSEVLDWPEKEVRDRFYNYEDHWITPKEALDLGLITQIEKKSTEKSALIDPQRASYAEVIRAAMRRPERRVDFSASVDTTALAVAVGEAIEKAKRELPTEEVIDATPDPPPAEVPAEVSPNTGRTVSEAKDILIELLSA